MVSGREDAPHDGQLLRAARVPPGVTSPSMAGGPSIDLARSDPRTEAEARAEVWRAEAEAREEGMSMPGGLASGSRLLASSSSRHAWEKAATPCE